MRSPRFFLFLENISYTLCEIKYQLIFMVGRWIWDDEILFQVYPIEVDSKWLRKRKEEHGTSLWVQEWGTKHQIKRFFFRYRNHPKNLLVSYLSTHPTSTSTSIFPRNLYMNLTWSPKNVGNEQKKDVRPADLIPTPGLSDSTTLRINVWTEGGWWDDGYYHGELKTLQVEGYMSS